MVSMFGWPGLNTWDVEKSSAAGQQFSQNLNMFGLGHPNTEPIIDISLIPNTGFSWLKRAQYSTS